jgi:tetratricopeptide (TPR) repeat protein
MDAGELYYALGRRETALELMTRAVRLKPSPRNLYRLGLYYERENDRERARVQFKAALERDPHSLPALLKLAQYAQPDPNDPRLTDEARGYYERVIEVQNSPYGRIRAIPEIVETAYGFAHLALARHYRALGETVKAQGTMSRHCKCSATTARSPTRSTWRGASWGCITPNASGKSSARTCKPCRTWLRCTKRRDAPKTRHAATGVCEAEFRIALNTLLS